MNKKALLSLSSVAILSACSTVSALQVDVTVNGQEAVQVANIDFKCVEELVAKFQKEFAACCCASSASATTSSASVLSATDVQGLKKLELAVKAQMEVVAKLEAEAKKAADVKVSKKAKKACEAKQIAAAKANLAELDKKIKAELCKKVAQPVAKAEVKKVAPKSETSVLPKTDSTESIKAVVASIVALLGFGALASNRKRQSV